jgi:hypothetical protein
VRGGLRAEASRVAEIKGASVADANLIASAAIGELAAAGTFDPSGAELERAVGELLSNHRRGSVGSGSNYVDRVPGDSGQRTGSGPEIDMSVFGTEVVHLGSA